jgi:hypothetical protein
LGFFAFLIIGGVVAGGGMLLLSWIFGVSLGSRYNRRNVIHPNYLPDLVKEVSKFAKRKTEEKMTNISKLIKNRNSSKVYRLKELGELWKIGIISTEEFSKLKKEIIDPE